MQFATILNRSEKHNAFALLKARLEKEDAGRDRIAVLGRAQTELSGPPEAIEEIRWNDATSRRIVDGLVQGQDAVSRRNRRGYESRSGSDHQKSL